MKQTRPYPLARLTPKGERALLAGHPWVYEAEVAALEGQPEPGGLVDVCGAKGAFLGTGFFSPRSKIRIRVFSRNANDRFDRAFWARRFQYAWDYRKTVLAPQELDCCRVIFGESDQFPGLTVDRFGQVLVAQTLSVGIERRKGELFPLLAQVLEASGHPVAGIYERNDLAIRELEGLEQGTGWFPLEGKPQPAQTAAEITENGVRYLVDFAQGQKTGFFLDQKYNRQAVARLARGRRVLDCFTHTGSFALNAALGGAAHVTAVDVSESALELARENARRNGLADRMDFLAADVIDLLPQLAHSPEKYDFIILDPPAFTKSRRTVEAAYRGYRQINLRAMQLLPRGGYLATCSCSHFMPAARFEQMLREAAAQPGVHLRQSEARQQPPHHPSRGTVPETDYLKFFLFQVV